MYSPSRRLHSYPERPGLRRFVRSFESGIGVDRLHGGRAVDVQHGVELPGQDGMEVVTESLRFWLVDDADCALQARFGEGLGHRALAPQIEHEVRFRDGGRLMQEVLVRP